MRTTARALVSWAILLGVAQAGEPASRPATQPVRWGDAQSGVRVSLSLDQPIVLGKTVELVGQIRNDGVTDLRLDGGFAWVLAVSNAQTAFYTAKVDLPGLAGQAAIPVGKTVGVRLSLGDSAALAYHKGIKVVQGYPLADGAQAPQVLREVLPPGKVRLQWMVYLPSVGGEKVLARSAALDAMVSTPTPEELSPQAKETALKELADQFRRDAFAAKAARDKAVQIGPDAVATVARIAQDAEAPGFGRMWAAAALAGIGDGASADVLVKLVDDPNEDVRDVVAYHGIKVKSEPLQAAIMARAEGGKDPVFAAWAARGLGEAGRQNERLTAAAFASTEPRARAEIAQTLATHADRANLQRLARLLADDQELVRVAAATAVGEHKIKDDAVLRALVLALDAKGDAACQKVCWALSQIVGNDWTFAPDDAPEKKDAIVRKWKDHFANP